MTKFKSDKNLGAEYDFPLIRIHVMLKFQLIDTGVMKAIKF
jgi:hypothetical protein